MTSPSDIAGLSERLRDDIHQLTKSMEATSFAGGETDVRVKGPSLLLTDLKDADTALDSLSARVKELEATLFAAQQAVLTEGMERIRAEQQRDEAYERAAKVADGYCGVNFPPQYQHAEIIATAIRRLASDDLSGVQ